ncbi:hypothetical protein [Paenibacillus caui]|uniref:hypothetical protein n=1 Tax=Paenibacillus caui TaxID=2873927 RepID=UPI001CAA0D43|nr:hypothetical protein [Paenibacillus caui]
MAEWIEYTGTLSLTLSEMGKAVDVQIGLLDAAKKRYSESALAEYLDSLGLDYSFLLQLFAKTSWGKYAGPAGIAYTTFKVVDAIVSDYTLDKVLEAGLTDLNANLTWFSQHSSTYQRIEFEVAFLEYTVNTPEGLSTIRYIQQATTPQRLQYHDGSWVSSS